MRFKQIIASAFIYDANSNSIIDFYCPLNPIIGKFWDFPTIEW